MMAMYHLTLNDSMSMKKPTIMMNTRFTGDGNPSPITLLTHDSNELLSYCGVIWNVGMPENSELVQRDTSPVAAPYCVTSCPFATPCVTSCWRSTLPITSSG